MKDEKVLGYRYNIKKDSLSLAPLRIHGNSSLMLRSEEEDIWQEQPDPNSLYKTLELKQEKLRKFHTK